MTRKKKESTKTTPTNGVEITDMKTGDWSERALGSESTTPSIVDNDPLATGIVEPPDTDARKIARRAALLAQLDAGVDVNGFAFDAMVATIRNALPNTTPQEFRHDLLRLMELKLAEERPPVAIGGPPHYMLTLHGEGACQALGATWTSVATSTLKGEDAPKPVVDPATIADSPNPVGWVDVMHESKMKSEAEKAAKEEAKANGKAKKSKKSDKEAHPQLGLGSAPGRFTMTLACPVGFEELEKLQNDHIAALDEIDAIEDERKEANEAFAARRKTKEGEESSLRAELKAARIGKVLRLVECEQRLDGSTMRVFRTDTWECVEERAASAAELQEPIAPPATTDPPEGVEVRTPEAAPPA